MSPMRTSLDLSADLQACSATPKSTSRPSIAVATSRAVTPSRWARSTARCRRKCSPRCRRCHRSSRPRPWCSERLWCLEGFGILKGLAASKLGHFKPALLQCWFFQQLDALNSSGRSRRPVGLRKKVLRDFYHIGNRLTSPITRPKCTSRRPCCEAEQSNDYPETRNPVGGDFVRPLYRRRARGLSDAA